MKATIKREYTTPEMEVIPIDTQDDVLEGSAWTEDFEEIEFNWSAAKKGRQIDMTDFEDTEKSEDSLHLGTTIYTPYTIGW